MTATDELRRMLDERGVEYNTRDGNTVKNTYWSCNGLRWGYTEDVDYSGMTDPMLFLTVGSQLTFTPEQAIATTLGAGTCKNVSDPPDGFLCSECGWGDFAEPSHLLTGSCYAGLAKGPRYCPNCGRKVEG